MASVAEGSSVSDVGSGVTHMGDSGGAVVDVAGHSRGVLSSVEVVGSSGDVLDDSGVGRGHEGEQDNSDLKVSKGGSV